MTQIEFPNPNHASSDGLLAVGGDLKPSTLLLAYSQGIFPWFNPGQPILWWSPDPRLVLYPTNFKCSRSLKQILKSGQFRVTANTSFAQVLAACASRGASAVPQGYNLSAVASLSRQDNATELHQAATWITQDMQRAYLKMHELGAAHSIEVWQNKSLVGGLYGLKLGNAFFGESMFSVASNASKVALAYLVYWAHQSQVHMIDCQITSDHLLSLGAKEISRSDFLQQVKSYVRAVEPTDVQQIAGVVSQASIENVINSL